MPSFESTSQFYSRYRVPYPEELLQQLYADVNLTSTSLVLDLASGPGRLGLALAPLVSDVIAVDVELEMIEEGKRLARQKNLANITWIHSKAEELEVTQDSVDLVTIGEAFHRLDQEVILQRISQWLKNPGCVVLAGCFGILHGEESWQIALRTNLDDWLKENSSNSSALPRGISHDVEQLKRAGFTEVVNKEFSGTHIWTMDTILGHLHSTSRFSVAALGDAIAKFENMVREALEPHKASGFKQVISCGYSIGWNESRP